MIPNQFDLTVSQVGNMRYITIGGIGYLASLGGKPAVLNINRTTHLTAEELSLISQMARNFNGFYEAIENMNEEGSDTYNPFKKQSQAEARHEE